MGSERLRGSGFLLLGLSAVAWLAVLGLASGPHPGPALLLLAAVALILEVRAVSGTRYGPFSCAASLTLAAAVLPEVGPRGALLIGGVGLAARWLLGPSPRRRDTYLADLFPLSAAMLAALAWTSPDSKLAVTVLTFLLTTEVAARALFPLQKATRVTRLRFALASAIGAPPVLWLTQQEPTAVLFLGALLLMAQSGGYMRIRQEDLDQTARSLQHTKQDLVQARREKSVTSHQLERTARERELVEGLAQYFAQNPSQEQVLEGCLEAVRPLFPEAERSLWRATPEGGFELYLASHPSTPAPPPSLLSQCWLRQSVRLFSQEGQSWLLAPLPEEGVLALRFSQPPELGDNRKNLLTLLASQFALGLQSARYRGQLEEALKLQTLTNRQLQLSQEQLVQSSKMAAVGQLAAGVAHELNSPLAAALLQVQLARMRLESATYDKVGKSLDTTEESLNLAREIIEKLLGFSRASQPESLRVDLGAVVRAAFDLVKEPLTQDAVEVRLDVPEGLWVRGAPTELQQVVVNLLLNARYACSQTERPRRIRIQGQLGPDFAAVIVSDSGPGIPEDVAPRIFEPFFTTKPIGEGTGLGLSISFEIVKAHHGTLEMRSSPEGASFRLALPRWKEPS